MSDPRNPDCPHGGTLLRQGTMNCPRHGDQPHVATCSSCLKYGRRRQPKPKKPDAASELLARVRQICFSCQAKWKCKSDLSMGRSCNQRREMQAGWKPTCPRAKFQRGRER